MNRIDFPQSRCRVGAARCDITPPVGIYHRMWGAATHDRSTGVHRPLTATALALAPLDPSNDERRILLAVDHCLFWSGEMQSLLDAVARAADLPREAVTVFFSHTHAAGLMGLERRSLPGGELIPPYLEELEKRLGEAAKEALSHLAPATILYGMGRCDLAANRDYFDEARGHYVCGYNPSGAADDTVLVAKAVCDSGQPLATIVNYACHPTTLAWENTLISPDYVGAMREVIESAIQAPCFFIQGASGDIGPREGYVGRAEVADRNGRQLGYAALSALESLPAPGMSFHYAGPVISGATLGAWKYEPIGEQRRPRLAAWQASRACVPLRYQSGLPTVESLRQDKAAWEEKERAAQALGDTLAARDARAMIERATRRLTRFGHLPPSEEYQYPLDICRIGDAIWIALDGEHYNLLQRALRERFPNTPLVIGTLANGSSVWYLPDAPSYGKGLYQEEASVLAMGSLEALIEAATEVIEGLLASPDQATA